jgi:hypothetical protein
MLPYTNLLHVVAYAIAPGGRSRSGYEAHLKLEEIASFSRLPVRGVRNRCRSQRHVLQVFFLVVFLQMLHNVLDFL